MLAAGNFGDRHAAVGEILGAPYTDYTDEQSRRACTATAVG